jgi:hypothetical protein
MTRPYPDLLSPEEGKALLARAEQLWRDLQANDLGGFSNGNRPFYILSEFKRVIEEFGRRDVGQTWSKDEIDHYDDAHQSAMRKVREATELASVVQEIACHILRLTEPHHPMSILYNHCVRRGPDISSTL